LEVENKMTNEIQEQVGRERKTFKGYMPFDGPFVIIDEGNLYCELLAKMYSSYQREFQEGKRDDKRIMELDNFLERMLKRECTDNEMREWVRHAMWRVESGKEDEYLRRQYLAKFPTISERDSLEKVN
jgi:hypothetical protein